MKDYVLAEFKDEASLCAAARRLRELGYDDLDAHSPIPLHGIDEALGLKKSVVPIIGLVGGIVGALVGYSFQTWMNAFDYAINVGARPLHAPPSNIPVTFETTVLLSSLCIVLGLIALCGFPRPHHPLMDHDRFRSATVDALWLTARVEPSVAERVGGELEKLGAIHVARVPEEERR